MKRTWEKENIRLAAFDIDGTLYDKGILPAATRETVQALARTGVETILATSRNEESLPRAVREMPCFRYGIFCNGAYLCDIRTGEIIETHAARPEEAREILKLLAGFTKDLHYVCPDHGVITESDIETLLGRHPEGEERESLREDLERHYRKVPNADAMVRSVTEPVIKFGCRFGDRESLKNAAREIMRRLDCEAVETDAFVLEITKRGCSKGEGLRALCRFLGIRPEEAVAFGDSGNDIPIFRTAGYAVAMGNAYDDVKEAADYVTGTLREGGLADAIRGLFL